MLLVRWVSFLPQCVECLFVVNDPAGPIYCMLTYYSYRTCVQYVPMFHEHQTLVYKVHSDTVLLHDRCTYQHSAMIIIQQQRVMRLIYDDHYYCYSLIMYVLKYAWITAKFSCKTVRMTGTWFLTGDFGEFGKKVQNHILINSIIPDDTVHI